MHGLPFHICYYVLISRSLFSFGCKCCFLWSGFISVSAMWNFFATARHIDPVCQSCRPKLSKMQMWEINCGQTVLFDFSDFYPVRDVFWKLNLCRHCLRIFIGWTHPWRQNLTSNVKFWSWASNLTSEVIFRAQGDLIANVWLFLVTKVVFIIYATVTSTFDVKLQILM